MPESIRIPIKDNDDTIIDCVHIPIYYVYELEAAWARIEQNLLVVNWTNKIKILDISAKEAPVIAALYLREVVDNLYATYYNKKTLEMYLKLEDVEENSQLAKNLVERLLKRYSFAYLKVDLFGRRLLA